MRHKVVNIRYANMSWDYSLDQFCEYKIHEISATHVHCTCSTHVIYVESTFDVNSFSCCNCMMWVYLTWYISIKRQSETYDL